MTTKMSMKEAGILGYQKSKKKLDRLRDKKIKKARKEWNRKKCEECGKEIPYEKRQNRFCGHSCSASSCNRKYPKRKRACSRKPCINCGKKLDEKGYNKFCNLDCFHKFYYDNRVKEWKDNESKIKNVGSPIRRYLFNKYKNKCCQCGWAETNSHTGKIPLEVDHIDGNHLNNKEDNLRILCPNCHSLTSTYKGANRSNGRTWRKKYYEKNSKK